MCFILASNLNVGSYIIGCSKWLCVWQLLTELHKFGGGLAEGEGKDCASAAASNISQVKATENTGAGPNGDVYNLGSGVGVGVPIQRSSCSIPQRTGERPIQKWKGPDKISKIYGDWIDDIE